MSFGNNPADRAASKQHAERFVAKADADRAARFAGRKSLFQRLRERLRPHHQDLAGDPQSNYGTSDEADPEGSTC
jgi:hypothetical protein